MRDSVLVSVAGYASAEFIEKKSRFIGHISPAATEEEAFSFLNQIRAEHKGATHNCYAWQIGEQDQFQRSADAGEPAGTAGRPILEAIKRADLHNTIIVVTRYFGGILLGSGGLTRAYGKSAALAIDAAQRVAQVPACRVVFFFDYGLLGKVESFLAQQDLVIEDKTYAEQVCFLCIVEKSAFSQIKKSMIELSSGTMRWQELEGDVILNQPIE